MRAGQRLFGACSLVIVASLGIWVRTHALSRVTETTREQAAPEARVPTPLQATTSFQGVHWYENRGQWERAIRYGMSIGGAWVGVTDGGIVLQLPDPEDGATSHRVTLHFEGASPSLAVEGRIREPGVHHAYLGNDPERWIRNVHSFHRVALTSLYPGIDLVLKEDGGHLKYDVHVAPHADLEQLVLRMEGGSDLAIEEDGGLVMDTPAGMLRHASARSWEVADEEPVPVEVRYRRIDDSRFGFEARDHDPSRPLVIDPELLWSTYWGGVGTANSIGDKANDVAVDALGNVTVVGTVEGIGSLMTPGAFQSPSVLDDIFVAKFRQSTGRLIYSARIGSSSMDDGKAVAVDDQGRATVVGWSGQGADDFPTTPGAFDPVTTGFRDAGVVFRLSPLGDELEYSTFLESTNGVNVVSVDLADSGAAIVTGAAFSNDYPTTPGAFNTIGSSGEAGFVTRLDPTGSFLEWSTFLPIARTADLQVDAQEDVYVTGIAGLGYSVTAGAFQTQVNGSTEGFVTKMAADGASLIWSTYLGGEDVDFPLGLVALSTGDVIVVGTTESKGFPVTRGAFQETHGGSMDAFITRFDSTGFNLVYSTFLGGTADALGVGVDADASGVVTLAGRSGFDFPTTPGAFDTDPVLSDAFLTRLLPDGSGLLYSTFLGGNSQETANSVATSPAGVLTVVGRTASGDYPTTQNAVSPHFIGGQEDAFITTFIPLLQGVSLVGRSRPSCLGPLQLNATTMPVAGQPFGVYCSQAPPNAKGVLVVRDDAGRTVYPVVSDPAGFVETPLGSLPSTPGAVLWCRFLFRNPPTCPGAGPFSSSNSLRIETQ